MWGRKDNTEFGGNLLCFSIFIMFLFTEGKLHLSIIRGDTLTRVDSISGRQSLISKDGIFELGFFTTGFSQNVYLGIWYKGFAEKTVVWVANRETPLPNKISSELKISPSGNLELFDGSDSFWSTNLTSALPDSVEAVLLDDGNLILRDGSKPTIVFWQSFDYPTDTWLPGAALGLYKKTGKKQRLVSWKSADDPSPGMFSLEISEDQNPGFFLEWNLSTKYWKSGSWNGVIFSSVPEISYFSEFKLVSNENETYYTYSLLNNAVFSRFVITESGNFEQITSLKSHRKWGKTFLQPKDPRDVFAFCGQFGIFNEKLSNHCTCPQGFSQISTGPNDWSRGCSRRTLLQCEGSNPEKGKKDEFLKISTMNLSANPVVHPAQSEKGCKLACQGSCSCSAYAFSESKCSIWDGALLNLQQPSDNLSNTLHLKVANSDAKGKHKILEVIVAVLVPLVVLVSGGFLACFYTWRIKKKGNKDSGDDLLSFDFDHSCNLADVGTTQGKRNKKDFDLPMFSYTSVSAATDNFSPDNKLGEGGFGPVYKGKLLNGQQIALKRLSKKSGQGFEEFRNEIILIAKLQHRNLVRLLGCCIEQDESILIYEYMPNKSLDFFLFDSNKRGMLDWATRVCIIEGIAQGLLYLHEHSRLRIIHRDLKASNILLGSEMKPKISDFGMARIFGGNDSQTNTKRIVGT